jgi:hypothetical protein
MLGATCAFMPKLCYKRPMRTASVGRLSNRWRCIAMLSILRACARTLNVAGFAGSLTRWTRCLT